MEVAFTGTFLCMVERGRRLLGLLELCQPSSHDQGRPVAGITLLVCALRGHLVPVGSHGGGIFGSKGKRKVGGPAERWPRMNIPRQGLMSYKTLEEHREWPLKYWHWILDVAEVEQEIFVCVDDLHKFHPGLPLVKELKVTYRRVMFFVKDGGRHFISDSGLRRLIKATAKGHEHLEALKFLEFFERNVVKQSTKKRVLAELDERNKLQQALASTVHSGLIAPESASPRWDMPTVPVNESGVAQLMPPEVAWTVPTKGSAPLAKLSVREWFGFHLSATLNSLETFWYGERNLFATLVLGIFVGFYPVIQLEALLPEDMDWAVHFQLVLWWNLLILLIAIASAVWFGVSMTRSMLRTCRTLDGFLWGITVYLLTLPVLLSIALQTWSLSLLEEWWDSVAGRYRPAEVYADQFLGRIVVKGQLRFGSSVELEKVLNANRKYTLIEIESPGGYVVEGVRMSKLVADRKLDVVSLEYCESACTLILASGTERFLGPKVEVGFHRSGRRYGPVSDGWSATDYQMAKLLKGRGVDEKFIQKAFIPSIEGMWYPEHGEMFAAGYATLKWSERRFGY